MATRFAGRVQRLSSPRHDFIRLDIPVSEQPYEDYFELLQTPKTHASYSFALPSAITSYSLEVRTTGDINRGDRGKVEYVVVDWCVCRERRIMSKASCA